MGVDGCIWVYMGALGYRGTSAQQNRVNREKNTQISHVSCPYGRGNFPGHHVLQHSTKSVKNGWRRVQMGSDGLGWVHGCRG